MTEEYTNYDDMVAAAEAALDRWEASGDPPPDPVRHYLESLPSLDERYDAASAVRAIAAVLTGCREGVTALDWGGLRAPQVRAIVRLLKEKYDDTDLVAGYLATLRGVLDTAHHLGLIGDADFAAAQDACFLPHGERA